MTITYEDFARDCCAALGCNANETQQLDTLVTVFTLEDSKAAYNPEDTTLDETGATDYNPEGVKNYPTLGVGLEAFKSTITEGVYLEIVRMLRAGDDASRVLACPEWDTWAGQPVTRDYAEVLAAVRNDRAAYYGRSIGEGTVAPPAPAPPPVEPVPTPTVKETTLPKIVVAAGDTAVYLVGGVPVVKQHIDNELTEFLISIGYEVQRDVDPQGLGLVPNAIDVNQVIAKFTQASSTALTPPQAAPELVPPQVVPTSESVTLPSSPAVAETPVQTVTISDPLTGGNPV